MMLVCKEKYLCTTPSTGNPRESGFCTNLTRKVMRYTHRTDVLYRASVVIEGGRERSPTHPMTAPWIRCASIALQEPVGQSNRFANGRERERPPPPRPLSLPCVPVPVL